MDARALNQTIHLFSNRNILNAKMKNCQIFAVFFFRQEKLFYLWSILVQFGSNIDEIIKISNDSHKNRGDFDTFQ